MSWGVSSYPHMGGFELWHTKDGARLGRRAGIHVAHTPNSARLGQPTHTVRVHDKLFMYPSGKTGEDGAYLGDGKYGARPSPELLKLIEAHGKDHAWMPLLDKLAEEYPEHFEGPVAEHTRARAGA